MMHERPAHIGGRTLCLCSIERLRGKRYRSAAIRFKAPPEVLEDTYPLLELFILMADDDGSPHACTLAASARHAAIPDSKLSLLTVDVCKALRQ